MKRVVMMMPGMPMDHGVDCPQRCVCEN